MEVRDGARSVADVSLVAELCQRYVSVPASTDGSGIGRE